MKRVLVESNWVFSYAAPAYRRRPDAERLVAQAAKGELAVYVPSISLREGRDAIQRKNQPRAANQLREFKRWAVAAGEIDSGKAAAADALLERYDACIRRDLAQLEARITGIEHLPGVSVFGLSDAMLAQAIAVRSLVANLKPFDEAILGGVLVRADELRGLHPSDELYFCELDGDLAPYDGRRNDRPELKALYDQRGLVFRADFDVT